MLLKGGVLFMSNSLEEEPRPLNEIECLMVANPLGALIARIWQLEQQESHDADMNGHKPGWRQPGERYNDIDSLVGLGATAKPLIY